MRSTRSRWRRFTISSQSRHSARAVRTKRSANAFAFGARTGVLMVSIPSLAKTASKSRVNLLPVAHEEAKRRSPLLECPGELSGLLGDPGARRVRGAAGQVDTSAAELDEEEHVQPPQRDRLDGEEVDREHARGLRSQERVPGESGALAGRAESRLAQDLRDGRCRDGDAEP